MNAPITELHGRAELLGSKLPPLMVAAERVAATVAQGVHGRRRVGQGESFWQYRHYEPGDAVQQIDWRRSARSDTVYLRENEWEAAQSVWLWADSSPSMRYSSGKNLPTKADRAELLTLALGSLLVRGGEHIAPLGRGATPSMGNMAVSLLAQALSERDVPVPGQKVKSLPPVEKLPKYGRLVLMSDLFEPLEDIHQAVGVYADQGVDGHILQIIDPAETSLPFSGRTRFEVMENEGSALIGRVEGVRDSYRQTLEDHRAGLQSIARLAGWSYGLHVTDQTPESALLSLYTSLAAPQDRHRRN